MEGEMIISDVLLGNLKPGDHIASERNGDRFEHHGIYMGEVNGVRMVIHFKAPIKDSTISSSAAQPVAEECTVCNYTPPHNGGRVNSCLQCFCRGKIIYIIKYKLRIQNFQPDQHDIKFGKLLRGYRNDKFYLEVYKGAELSGHIQIQSDEIKNREVDNHILLSKYPSCRSPAQVLAAAQSNHYMGNYSFLFNNCEDFAVCCMIGKERSIQAEKKLHRVPYKVGKFFHLITDRRKMKDKLKAKALRFLAH